MPPPTTPIPESIVVSFHVPSGELRFSAQPEYTLDQVVQYKGHDYVVKAVQGDGEQNVYTAYPVQP
jgi:hypothetical protein